MPSVNDAIRFRKDFDKAGKTGRAAIIADTSAWLVRDIVPAMKQEDVWVVREFMAVLQKCADQEELSAEWYMNLGMTYARYDFYDRFLRRLRKN